METRNLNITVLSKLPIRGAFNTFDYLPCHISYNKLITVSSYNIVTVTG